MIELRLVKSALIKMNPKQEAEARELMRQISDPQDLNEALKSVAFDNLSQALFESYEKDARRAIESAALGMRRSHPP